MNREIKPFLRWAGGKNKLVKRFLPYLPDIIFERSKSKYFEPFLGAGSLYFKISPNNAYISDINKDLINSYIHIRDHPETIYNYLSLLKKKNNEKDYYDYREKFNKSRDSILKSAIFIYLNRTNFNGIWRVNKKGNYNVPFGYKEKPPFVSREELYQISKQLQNTEIKCHEYEDIIDHIKENDFVYFDPPYPPLNGTSYFTHYTKERFDLEDHKKLSIFVKKVDELGCNFMISNAYTKEIINLYKKNYNIYDLDVYRVLQAIGKDKKAKECIITNY